MDEWIIYYNGQCGSCRKALEILKEKGIEPKLVEYLKNPPSLKQLNALLHKLRVKPREIIRAKEPVYEKLKLDRETLSRVDLLRAVCENPILLQRPIVVHGQDAVIARPPENVANLF